MLAGVTHPSAPGATGRPDVKARGALHVLFIVESGTDGRLVEGLAERFGLTVFARRIHGGREISFPPGVPVDTVIGPSGRLRFAFMAARHAFRWRASVDRVIVQGYGPAALVANLLARLTRTPTLMLVCSPVERYYACRRHHAEPGKPYRWHELLAITALARLNGWLGRHYLVLSTHLADVVRSHGSGKEVSLTPVYGVDMTRFHPPTDGKLASRRRQGLPESGTIVLFSSRVAPEKDAETLLEAVRLLLDAGRDIWVLHRSGGHMRFTAVAAAFGVAHRVISTDAVHPHRALPLDYQACDLCVQASREEGLGFSALEALACEVPVIATAVGGLRETIMNGRTGSTYPVGDFAALAACIAAAIDEPEMVRRTAIAGRQMVEARFERGRVFDALEDVLRSPAGRR